MRAEGQSPNLINGVSRQGPELRLSSQAEESVNLFPSVANGLCPRAPLVRVSSVSAPNMANEFIHTIDRDEDEQYNVRISPTGVVVTHEDGTPRTVNAPSGYGYLSGATKDDFFALTVADHTYILNRKKVVQKATAKSPARPQEALVHIASGEDNCLYDILMGGTLVARWRSLGGPYVSAVDAQNGVAYVVPSQIARFLLDGGYEEGTEPFYSGFVPTPTGQGAKLLPFSDYVDYADFIVTQYANVLHFTRVDGGTFNIEIKCGLDGNQMRLHRRETVDFSLLPNRAPEGYVIKVTNSKEASEDDYYVKFSKTETTGMGIWEETVAPDSYLTLDPSTMPHLLVREADGTFTFKPITWSDRAAGDDDTNPFPSFTGKTIETMTFFKRRLGFFSGENYSFSRVGQFYNFFNESAITGLDTDPIDGAIDFDDISTIRHASATDGGVILLTDSVPFLLSGGEVFSYKTANVDPMLSFKPAKGAPPVSIGDSLYIVADLETYSAVRQLRYDRDSGVKEAPDVSEHVPGYIPPNVTLTAGDATLRVLFLYSPDRPDELFLYRWLVADQRKLQSAWQKWKLPVDSVRAMKIVGNRLVLSCQVGSYLEVLSTGLSEVQSQEADILLDRRVQVSGTYNVSSGRTTWTAPYPNPAVAVVASGDLKGVVPSGLVISGTSVSADGDWSANPVYLGMDVETALVLSEFVYRSKRSDGSEGIAIPGTTLTVAAATFLFSKSAAVKVTVDKAYRATRSQVFSATAKGTKTGLLGEPVIGTIDARVSLMANSKDFSITITNASYFPFSLLGMRWTGDASSKGY